jgi:SynChlorMet cassette protein ScmD
MSNTLMPIANSVLVLREEFDDWAVLFDPDSGNGVGLNPVSAFIWKLLDGEHTEDEILREMGEHFEDVPEEAGEHVKEFVEELVRRGFAGYEIEGG